MAPGESQVVLLECSQSASDLNTAQNAPTNFHHSFICSFIFTEMLFMMIF